MFSRALALLPFALLASASYLNARNDEICSTGTQQCCNQVVEANQVQENKEALLGVLGLSALNDILAANVGVAGGCIGSVGTCKQSVVCCNNDNTVALINAQCNNFNIL